MLTVRRVAVEIFLAHFICYFLLLCCVIVLRNSVVLLSIEVYVLYFTDTCRLFWRCGG